MSAVSDLAFFAMLVKHGSMAAVAREMGVTPPVISKTLASLEARLGVRLLNRSTRRMSVTQEGELYFAQGSRILAEIEELESTVAASRAAPRGLLRVNASIGFGRRHIGPAITAFAREYPEVEVQLQVSDRPANLADTAFDVGIRIGALPDSRLYARRIAANERWLCAAPQYLRGRPPLAVPRDRPATSASCCVKMTLPMATGPCIRGGRRKASRCAASSVPTMARLRSIGRWTGRASCSARSGMWRRICVRAGWCACCPSGAWRRPIFLPCTRKS